MGGAGRLAPTIHRVVRLLSVCGKIILKVISWKVAAKNSKQKAQAVWKRQQNGTCALLGRDLAFVKL